MTNDKTVKTIQRYDDLLPDLSITNDDKQQRYAEQRRTYREQNPVVAAQYKL